jgi:hypothetical protein
MHKCSKILLTLATTSILFTIIAVSFFPVDDLKTYAQSANATKYKYEPFLTLTDSKFQDIPDNNDNLNLTEFTLAAWFRTTQNNNEPGHIVNKGGMNTDKKGMNLNYGIWTNKEDGLPAVLSQQQVMISLFNQEKNIMMEIGIMQL